MGRILLIRHAEHPLLGSVLVGRDDGKVHLSDAGRVQAIELARSLSEEGVDCLQSSPRLRCLETAAELGEAFDLPVIVENALDEIDFGAWNGAAFEALQGDPLWEAWNRERSRTCPPGGESMAEASGRILQHLDAMQRRHPSRTIAMVTHAEIIRAVRLYQARLSLDAWNTVTVIPASVTEIESGFRALTGPLLEAAAS